MRILGPVTPEALETLAHADDIFIHELRVSGEYDRVWQAFAVLLPVRTVGVMGDGRTYDQVVALRAVTSSDGMTADWARLPEALLARVSSRIVNEVKGVNRVVYDISTSPRPPSSGMTRRIRKESVVTRRPMVVRGGGGCPRRSSARRSRGPRRRPR